MEQRVRSLENKLIKLEVRSDMNGDKLDNLTGEQAEMKQMLAMHVTSERDKKDSVTFYSIAGLLGLVGTLVAYIFTNHVG